MAVLALCERARGVGGGDGARLLVGPHPLSRLGAPRRDPLDRLQRAVHRALPVGLPIVGRLDETVTARLASAHLEILGVERRGQGREGCGGGGCGGGWSGAGWNGGGWKGGDWSGGGGGAPPFRVERCGLVEGIREDVGDVLGTAHAVGGMEAVIADDVAEAEASDARAHVGLERAVHGEARLPVERADARRLRLRTAPRGVGVDVPTPESLPWDVEGARLVLEALAPLVHREEDEQRPRVEGEQHARRALHRSAWAHTRGGARMRGGAG